MELDYKETIASRQSFPCAQPPEFTDYLRNPLPRKTLCATRVCASSKADVVSSQVEEATAGRLQTPTTTTKVRGAVTVAGPVAKLQRGQRLISGRDMDVEGDVVVDGDVYVRGLRRGGAEEPALVLATGYAGTASDYFARWPHDFDCGMTMADVIGMYECASQTILNEEQRGSVRTLRFGADTTLQSLELVSSDKPGLYVRSANGEAWRMWHRVCSSPIANAPDMSPKL